MHEPDKTSNHYEDEQENGEANQSQPSVPKQRTDETAATVSPEGSNKIEGIETSAHGEPSISEAAVTGQPDNTTTEATEEEPFEIKPRIEYAYIGDVQLAPLPMFGIDGDGGEIHSFRVIRAAGELYVPVRELQKRVGGGHNVLIALNPADLLEFPQQIMLGDEELNWIKMTAAIEFLNEMTISKWPPMYFADSR